jgi:hypothetical protein
MARLMSSGYVGMLLVVFCGLGGCAKSITSPNGEPSKPAMQASQPPTTAAGAASKEAAATQLAPEIYRQVNPEDGIRFYSRATSEEFRADGYLHQEGFECGVIGDDHKEIGIALVSTTIDHGLIRTKDFGILKTEMVSPMVLKLLATESQIKKLRALQSSRQ